MKISLFCFVKKAFLLSLILSTQLAFGGPEQEMELVPMPTAETTITKKRQIDTKGLRMGVYLLLMGFAQIAIGVTDPIFHIDHHDGDDDDHTDGDNDVFYEASTNTDNLVDFAHDDEDLFVDTQPYIPSLPESTQTGHPLDHNESSIRTLRQYGHIIEGTCTIISGVIKVYLSVCGNPKHSRLLKIASNTMQALSAVGTIMAASSDFLHVHLAHAICHTVQALCTMAQTIPNIIKKLTNTVGLAPADIDKRDAFRQKFIITGNIIDVIPSVILSVLMKSPPYAVEAVFNFLMGFENILSYRNGINTKKALVVTADASPESASSPLLETNFTVELNPEANNKLKKAMTDATSLIHSNTSAKETIEETKLKIDTALDKVDFMEESASKHNIPAASNDEQRYHVVIKSSAD